MYLELAQIVGLLASFTASRESGDLVNNVEFLTYLTKHGHDGLRESIEQNCNVTISIKALLNDGLDNISEQLNGISDQIASLLSHSEGMKDLAVSYPTTVLPNQVIEILTLMENDNIEYFTISPVIGTKRIDLILNSESNYTCKEKRFFIDDLDLMKNLNLLVEDYNSNGDIKYCFTRAASQLVNSIPNI